MANATWAVADSAYALPVLAAQDFRLCWGADAGALDAGTAVEVGAVGPNPGSPLQWDSTEGLRIPQGDTLGANTEP